MGKEVKPKSREASEVQKFNIWEAIAVMTIVILLAGVAAFTFTDYTEPPTVEGQTQYATFRLTGSVAVFLVVGAGILFGLKMIKTIMAPAFILAAAFIVGPEFYQSKAPSDYLISGDIEVRDGQGAPGNPAPGDMEERDLGEIESLVMALREENRMIKEENRRISEENNELAVENAILMQENAVLVDSIAVDITGFSHVERAISEQAALSRKIDSLTTVNNRLQRIIQTRGILN